MLQVNWESKVSEGLRRCCRTGARHEHSRIIIEFSGMDTGEIKSLIRRHHGRVVRDINSLHGIVAEVPFSAIESLAKSSQVKKIWNDPRIKVCNTEKFSGGFFKWMER